MEMFCCIMGYVIAKKKKKKKHVSKGNVQYI